MKKKKKFKFFLKPPKFTKGFGINFDLINPVLLIKKIPRPSDIAAMPKWKRHIFI